MEKMHNFVFELSLTYLRMLSMRLIVFLRNWALPVSILSGIIGYFCYVNMTVFDFTRPWINGVVSVLQPALIFCMLFITFCKVSPHELRPHKWQAWLLVTQLLLCGTLVAALCCMHDMKWRIIMECALLCLICPTATAGAVVTTKLGGDAAAITTYTIIINVAVALIGPMVIPVIHPQDGVSFVSAFLAIMHKVFPILICPLLLAWFVRYFVPSICRYLACHADLAFYLWTVSLAIAIAVSCKVIVHSNVSVFYMSAIAIATLICCIIQFVMGKLIGNGYGMRLEAGQSLGQKNTVFIIWLGYTFFTPITATAGGFYSIWHNLVNSYQLYKYRSTGNPDKRHSVIKKHMR